MNEKEQKKAAKMFAEYWKDKGDEKSDTQNFWRMLLHDVLGIEEPEKFIEFEKKSKGRYNNIHRLLHSGNKNTY